MTLPLTGVWLPLKYNEPRNFTWREQTFVCMRIRGGVYQVREVRHVSPVACVRRLYRYTPYRFAMVGWGASGDAGYQPIREVVQADLHASMRAAIAHAADLVLEKIVQWKFEQPTLGREGVA